LTISKIFIADSQNPPTFGNNYPCILPSASATSNEIILTSYDLEWVNGFNVVYLQFIAMCTTVVGC